MEEEWFTVHVKPVKSDEEMDVETKLNKKIDVLQTLVHQQSEMIMALSQQIKELKSELHSTTHQSASQNDRTHQLLEELKRVKERELNAALRRHQPVPFYNSNHMLQWDGAILRTMPPLSPLFRGSVVKSGANVKDISLSL
jgi:type I site-specific restriction-modification system R (restriction) subunit